MRRFSLDTHFPAPLCREGDLRLFKEQENPAHVSRLSSTLGLLFLVLAAWKESALWEVSVGLRPTAAFHLSSVSAPRVGVTLQHSGDSGVIGFLVNFQILCLQEVQEDHYWEQLEPSLRMMGNAAPWHVHQFCLL